MDKELNSKLHGVLQSIVSDIEDAGRQLYYALSFLPIGHEAEIHIIAALKHIGVYQPSDVGLSDYQIAAGREKLKK